MSSLPPVRIMEDPVSDVLVLGIGNLLWADEGFGVRCAETLAEGWSLPSGVRVMDGGTQGLYLLPYVQGARRLIVFDAVDYGLPPGTVKLVEDDEVPRFMGAKNALGGFQGYRPMTAEAMALAAPDLILMTTQGLEAVGGADAFWQRPELALTPAYRRRDRALLQLDALELLGFGPRLPDVIEKLHRAVVA
jgi:hydrogenase expression/formation protein